MANFKVWAEDKQNLADLNNKDIDCTIKPGDSLKANEINSILRQNSLVVTALMNLATTNQTALDYASDLNIVSEALKQYLNHQAPVIFAENISNPNIQTNEKIVAAINGTFFMNLDSSELWLKYNDTWKQITKAIIETVVCEKSTTDNTPIKVPEDVGSVSCLLMGGGADGNPTGGGGGGGQFLFQVLPEVPKEISVTITENSEGDKNFNGAAFNGGPTTLSFTKKDGTKIAYTALGGYSYTTIEEMVEGQPIQIKGVSGAGGPGGAGGGGYGLGLSVSKGGNGGFGGKGFSFGGGGAGATVVTATTKDNIQTLNEGKEIIMEKGGQGGSYGGSGGSGGIYYTNSVKINSNEDIKYTNKIIENDQSAYGQGGKTGGIRYYDSITKKSKYINGENGIRTSAMTENLATSLKDTKFTDSNLTPFIPFSFALDKLSKTSVPGVSEQIRAANNTVTPPITAITEVGGGGGGNGYGGDGGVGSYYGGGGGGGYFGAGGKGYLGGGGGGGFGSKGGDGNSTGGGGGGGYGPAGNGGDGGRAGGIAAGGGGKINTSANSSSTKGGAGICILYYKRLILLAPFNN